MDFFFFFNSELDGLCPRPSIYYMNLIRIICNFLVYFYLHLFLFLYFHIDIVHECIVLRCIVKNKLTLSLTVTQVNLGFGRNLFIEMRQLFLF